MVCLRPLCGLVTPYVAPQRDWQWTGRPLAKNAIRG